MEPWMLLPLLLLCAARETVGLETTEEVPSTHTPHVLSASKTVVVRRGEEAIFDCEVDELGGFAKVWKKDEILYFTNDYDFVGNPRVQLTQDKKSLRVLRVEPDDAGDYVCQISTEPPLELRHRLVVIVPPTVAPVPQDGKITVGVGQNFSLRCLVEGSPRPTVTWTHSTETANKEVGEGDALKVWMAKENHAGEYLCTVNNGYDPPVRASFRVRVLPAGKEDKEDSKKTDKGQTDATFFPVEYEPTPASDSRMEEDKEGTASLPQVFPLTLIFCCLLPFLR